MDIRNKLVFKILLGLSVGLLIGAVFSSLSSFDEVPPKGWQILIEIVGSGIFGAAAMGGSIVYSLEDWGVTKATFVHYIITFMAFFVVNELLNWFPYSILFIVIIIMTIMYFIIGLIEFLICRAQVRQLNRQLEVLMEDSGRD